MSGPTISRYLSSAPGQDLPGATPCHCPGFPTASACSPCALASHARAMPTLLIHGSPHGALGWDALNPSMSLPIAAGQLVWPSPMVPLLLPAGVIFQTNRDGSLPPHVMYKIRQNSSFTEKTNEIRRAYWRPGPNTGGRFYFLYGFVWIQGECQLPATAAHIPSPCLHFPLSLASPPPQT